MSWTMVVRERRLQSRVAGLGQVTTPAASARLFEDIEKFQPFRMVQEIRDAVQEGREAVGEMRVHLGGLSPTLKAAMVVTAVSTGSIALLLLLDFVGLNPFNSGRRR